jgi:hypothetical protein
MNTLLAVGVIGLVSLALRAVPLLSARRLPDQVAHAAGAGGMSVMVAITTRAVLEAALAVVGGMATAFRGRGVIASVAVGAAVYLAVSLLFRTT